ncbi:MAG: HAMP domain-containing protein [Candidatus Zixiibacteriota bacterium]|nr:MAG: HAMP domain-containing protein [candidate division Zixibacteria bacterium]
MSFFGSIRRFALREKFVLLVSVVTIASMLVISGYLIKRQNETYYHELQKRGKALVANLAYNAEYGVILESKSELENLIRGVARTDDVVYISIHNLSDSVLAQLGKNIGDSAREIVSGPAINDAEGKFRHTHYKTADGMEYIEFCHPVETERMTVSKENLGLLSGDQFGAGSTTEIIGMVHIGLTLENLKEEINESEHTSILLALLVVLSAIFIMTAFVRIITRPIEGLVEVTDQISKGDLSRFVEIRRQDEIGQLSESFNRMIESLKQSQDEIEEYNRTLEEKIIERTRELEDAQAQLIQSEKMAALGQLAAGVAHELNNPLGGILGYAQFTLEKMEKVSLETISVRDLESYQRYLKDIESQSRRCKTIVQNLLKFSRSSNAVEFEDISINQVMEETLTFIEHQLMMKQIMLVRELGPNLPHIRGNAGQLQQVFTNIIINAMHASESGSEISIHTRYLPPLGEFPGAVEICITDQGIGIGEENLKKVFEPFFTTKEVGKGTGLGLSVSYGIIKEHGGEVKIKSKLGEGTTFTIVFQLEKTPTSADTYNN